MCAVCWFVPRISFLFSGYVEAKKKFGNPNLTLMDLLQPTIDLCEKGFKVTRSLERAIKQFEKNSKYDENLR